MKQIILFIIVTLVGYGVGAVTQINPIDQALFQPFTSLALIIGLYGSVIGIDLEAIRHRRRLTLIVITIAVPIQILTTGAVMYLIYPAAISLLIAVAMTQIDPLSVDTLLRDKEKMSEEAKGILRVWASFDDPVTVLFGFLILLPLVSEQTTGLTAPIFLFGVIANVVPALLVYWLKTRSTLLNNPAIELTLLVLLLVYCFFIDGFLLAALLGLILRPIPERYFSQVIYGLYQIIVFTVGMALFTYGIDLRLGILIALVEFFIIQPLTSIIVFNGTPSDLIRVAFSQQNGLTTLLMGVAFQSLGIEILHVLLPGIVVVNILNLVVNRIYTYKEQHGLIEGV